MFNFQWNSQLIDALISKTKHKPVNTSWLDPNN